jgi:hypothetical protein
VAGAMPSFIQAPCGEPGAAPAAGAERANHEER